MYIRYFADTSDPRRSPIARYALDYLKAMLTFRPAVAIRLVSAGAGLAGAWEGCSALLMTPMEGELVNVVCCLPARWTWLQRIPPRPGSQADDPVDHERVGLWTAGARNVLLAPFLPSDPHAIAAAMQYDTVVVPDQTLAERWSELGKEALILADPTASPEAFRCTILA